MIKLASRLAKNTTSPQFLIPFIILAIATVSRFWHLASLFNWTLDEEFWSFVPNNIATGYHFPLIGGHISGTGLYSGPLFVWVMAPVYWLVRGNPLDIAFFVSTLGVVSVYLMIKLWPALLSSRTVLLTALLYSASTLTTIYDRKYWNATPISFLAIITIYLIHRLHHQPSTRLSLFLAFVLTLAFHAHMTSGALIIFVFLCWFLFRLPRRQLTIFAAAFFLFQTPLIIFEIRHGFTNTHALIKLFTGSSHSGFSNLLPALKDTLYLTVDTFARLIYFPARDLSHELTLCSEYARFRTLPPLFSQVMATIVLIYAIIQLKFKNLFSLLITTNILLLFIYRLIAPSGSWYPGLLSEYYLLPSFAAFLAIAASLIIKLYHRTPILSIALILMLVIINLHATFNLKHSHSLDQKQRQIAKAITLIDHQPFTFNVTGDPCQIYGYRYLFAQIGIEPVTSYVDPVLGWLYNRQIPTQLPELDLTLNADSGTIKVTPYEQAHPSPQNPNSQR